MSLKWSELNSNVLNWTDMQSKVRKMILFKVKSPKNKLIGSQKVGKGLTEIQKTA